MKSVQQRLSALREAMKKHGVDAFVIPSADPHLSEYLPEHWQARRDFSGFTGSAGTLVVTADKAGVWTDSRYWEQAGQQLSPNGIELQKMGVDAPYTEWLAQNLPEGAVVGAPADMFALSGERGLKQALAAKNIRLEYPETLLDEVWDDRPALPTPEIYVHHPDYVSETAAEKLARIRAAMKEQGADVHLVSSLDDIAWITNLRGDDVPFNPVFLSHLFISQDKAVLFTDAGRLKAESAEALKAAGFEVLPYAQAADYLAGVKGALLIDPNKTAVGTLRRLPEDVRLIEAIHPSTFFKSVKSDADIAHIRNTMAEDGAALCGFFAEFEQILADGGELSELDIDGMLYKHRSQRPGFISPSFDTIAGYNANAALPHYSATPENNSKIKGDGMLLIDSGGQYWGGTTDITRVVPVGNPSAAMKRDYTLVLKAHISLAETIFPENIKGPMIDAICRKSLWQAQCDYGHGTGHGVGYFLNVHQGPQKIAYNTSGLKCNNMKENMITSNEPGLYRPGKWGFRIENLVVHRRVKQPKETEFGQYLYFEQLTLCPIDTQLIERSMLSDEEAAWLNDYHALVREKLAPHTEGAAKEWLERNTQPI